MLEKGTMVAGYRVDGVLGEGGMGVVYRATQVSLNRTIALKILAGELTDDPAFRERFRREGLLQAAIDHPHIVTVYEAGETEQGLFLAMRLVRGPTLKDLILGRELDAARSTQILGQVADALDTAHDVGLTHRDIKPQNILVGARDHAYLADFGLTKAPDETGLTETGQFVGTIDYVAPEQIRGEGASARSDVYALAGVLYECLSGSIPYPKPTESATIYAHISDPPPKLTEKRPELPAALDDVIAKGMAKDPDDRYPSAGELMRATDRAFGKTERSAASPPGPIAAAEEAGVRPSSPGLTAASPAPPTRRGEPVAATAAGGVTARAGTAPPAAPPTPAPAAPARERGLPLAVIVVAALVLAAVGYLVGSSGGSSEEERPELASSASAGSLGVSFPSGWRRVEEETGIPGIEFSQPIVLAPGTGTGTRERVVAGMVDAKGPELLPSGFLERLDGAPSRDDAVELGELQAYRYRGLQPEGLNGAVTLYTVPTSRGVATVACRTPQAGAEAFLADCEEVATTLELTGGKAFTLGPQEAYASAVGRALRTLDSAESAGTRKLRSADTPDGQASAAGELQRAYDRAARAVAGAEASPADAAANDRLAAALRRLASDYRELSSAARAGDSAGYDAASRSVRSDGTRLRRAIRDLEKLGYSVS